VGPVLRGALVRLETEASTSSQGQAPAAAEALAARIAGLRAVLDAVPRTEDNIAQRALPLQALFSSEHPVIKGLLQRYGALPATGAFTGKGVRFAIPVVKVVRLPPTTKAGTQWANVDVAAGKYRVAERQFVEGWRTTQDFVLGRPGKYKLHVVPRQPLPKGVPVVGCDPGVNCPLFTDTGVYLFSEDWYRARRLRIQSRKKPSNVRRAEGELATTIARAVGQLEYLEYVKKRGGENEATLMAHYGSGVKLRAHETLLARKRSLLATILAAIAPDPNTVIVIGDLYRGRRALRGWARTPVLKVILEFLASQRRVVFVDEYNTSKFCSSCETELKTTGPRTKACPNQSCSASWNRDVNGALNILKIWEAWVSGELRPAYLCRPGDDGTGNY